MKTKFKREKTKSTQTTKKQQNEVHITKLQGGWGGEKKKWVELGGKNRKESK